MGVRIEGVKRDHDARFASSIRRDCRDSRLANRRDARWTTLGLGRKIPPMRTHTRTRVKVIVGSAAVGLTVLVAPSAARAQIAAAAAAEPQFAAPPPVPEAATGPETPPAGIEPAPAYPQGYPYGPPPPAYYRPIRYRAAPYGYGAPAVVESMEGFHTHDGLYLRFHLGIAGTGFSSTQAGVKTNYAGGGSSTGIAIGGVIAHDLILYGTAFGTSTANPDKQVGGVSKPGDVGSIGVGAIGPGMAYYFEHLNLYLSAAFGLAGFTMNDGNGFRIDTSRSGTALELIVGKEWWVSRDWGLGIAAELMGASLKDKNTPGLSWSAGSGALLFSATYN